VPNRKFDAAIFCHAGSILRMASITCLCCLPVSSAISSDVMVCCVITRCGIEYSVIQKQQLRLRRGKEHPRDVSRKFDPHVFTHAGSILRMASITCLCCLPVSSAISSDVMLLRCCSVAVLQFQNKLYESQKLTLYFYIYKYIYKYRSILGYGNSLERTATLQQLQQREQSDACMYFPKKS